MFAALLLALTTVVPVPFTFSGRVVDPMGAPLADATVAAACAAAPPRAATTDARGAFTLVLPPGRGSLAGSCPSRSRLPPSARVMSRRASP